MGVAALAAAAAQAQAVPNAPRPPTREEVERPQPRDVVRRPRLTVDSNVERAPCALEDPAYASIRVTLTGVDFGGLKGLSPEAMRPAYEPFLGAEQPISIVCQIRDRAATILRRAGYVAAVEIPEQHIAGGRLRLEALMAKLVAVRVRGDAGRSERLIARYLGKLTGRDAFNRIEAERYLLLARGLPGYDVRLTLRSAGGARGEVIGEVVVEREPGAFEASIQNFGSHALGPWGAMVRGELYGVTGLGDRTSLAAYSTADFNEQYTLQLGHEFRVGSEGMTLGARLTWAEARPDLDDGGLDVRARTAFATIEAAYPLRLSQAGSLRLKGGFDMVDQRVRLNDLPLSRDRLRIAFARLEFDRMDRASVNGVGGYSLARPRRRVAATVEARQGLGILGASPDCGPGFLRCVAPGAVPPSRLEGEASATVLRVEALGEYRPRPKLTLALALRAQATRDSLLSFEQFAAGNYTVGRGYAPGALLGDRGAGVQAELRYGSVVPKSAGAFTAEPYVFLDLARVAEAGRIPVLVGPRSLASGGAGVRASIGDRAHIDAVLAIPLQRAGLQTRRSDPRFLVSLTTRLRPWSRK